MVDQRPSASSIRDFATWEPLLRLLRADREKRDATGSAGSTGSIRVAGRIDRYSWSLDLRRPHPAPGRAAQVEDMQEEFDAAERVQSALADAGIDSVSFAAEIHRTGQAVLRLFEPGPAVDPGVGNPHPGALLLVDGALPEPWRRLPDPVTGAAPAPSADPEALERSLRERLPDAIGATEEEIAATETRLGFALPAELKALYRVTRARWEDHGGDYEAAEREAETVGCELFDLDGLYVADASSRHFRWGIAAAEAVDTPPDAAVQGLVGSPGWIAFGDNGGGDRLAVDLTPGPRGHTGQVILLSHEEDTGASLIADSLTDLVLGRTAEEGEPAGPETQRPPLVARVNIAGLKSVEAAAHPRLEVLSIGVLDGAPLSLAPVLGLPGLRTLTAYPGTLADPSEIAGLTGLEFLELGLREWRVLLDADAVPRGLSAAAIVAHGDWDPVPAMALANEILALRDRPLIVQTVLEGDVSAS
ncbi:SMI1/KNR4 family protein [Streptomyces sp. STR69]|uniref:SMI1/KNR4 family protein n=1 Tax=Streptomyces sp. STR69 TaxID=1796942 RepID=UPI0021C8B636|nr:SMI1/KNR4 family protein [Streptomyces sp. STR69]